MSPAAAPGKQDARHCTTRNTGHFVLAPPSSRSEDEIDLLSTKSRPIFIGLDGK